MSQAQAPSNAPASTTQVPSVSSVATTPSGYIMGGQTPKVNFVRERDAMGRITDTVQFSVAAFGDVKETMHY
ncbi:MAG TPA: hypothetical protein VE035_00145, partial [Puia sp.]|nr:hypothetical protein [Puia sp.]